MCFDEVKAQQLPADRTKICWNLAYQHMVIFASKTD